MRRLLLAVCALFLLAACSSGAARTSTQSSGLNDNPVSKYQGFGMDPPQPRPAFTLTDDNGQPFSFATATAGKPTFLYFGYTHCPDVCPTTMADIGIALKSVPAALRAQTQVVFVTTDVTHDTGPVIKSWLSAFETGLPNQFIGLYGTQAQIDAAQAASHILIAEDNGKTHSSQVLLYGRDNYAHVSFVYNDSGEQKQMQHDIPLVVNAT